MKRVGYTNSRFVTPMVCCTKVDAWCDKNWQCELTILTLNDVPAGIFFTVLLASVVSIKLEIKSAGGKNFKT